jgi:hypothetical protein
MRKSMIACLAVVLVLAGGMIALLGPRHCPVNKAAIERIEEGMTRAEVHAILGGTPGDYRTGPPAPPPLLVSNFKSGPPSLIEVWEGDEGKLTVDYDVDEFKVMFTEFEVAEPYRSGPMELARWRLGKLKEAVLP